MAFAIAVFVIALALIASERVDRTKIALLGATIVVLAGTLDQEQAIDAVDFNTIGLLVGMMIMVRVTETTGVYTWLAIRAGQLSKGRPLAVVLALAITTAVLSAFLDNVTTILLVVPITFLLADALDVDPVPLIVIEIVASNLGGTATLIGDPPNILIAGHTGLSFGAFIANLAPIVILTLVVVIPGLYFAFRSRLQIAPEARERVMSLDAAKSIEDAGEAKRTVPILVLTILVFFIHKPLHLEPATVALAGAAVTLLVSRQSLARHGLLDRVADAVLPDRAVRDGRRAGGDGRARGGRERHRVGHRRQPDRRAARDPLGVGDRLRPGGQHPVHRGDDPGRGLAGRATTRTGGRSRSAPASVATRRSSPPPATSPPPACRRAPVTRSASSFFLRYGLPVTAVSLILATAYVMLRYA